MSLGDIKDIAILALVGVGAYLLLKPGAAKGVGETIGAVAIRVPGEVIAGTFAGAQSAVTGQSAAEIYAHAREGTAILNEWAKGLLNPPPPATWEITGGGLSTGDNL
jgi:hypothetical protein